MKRYQQPVFCSLLFPCLFYGITLFPTDNSRSNTKEVIKKQFEMITVTGGMFIIGGKDDAIDGGPAGDANRDEWQCHFAWNKMSHCL